MKKINFLIMLFTILLTSCSKEEEQTVTNEQQDKHLYINDIIEVPAYIKEQKRKKEFFDIDLEKAERAIRTEKDVYDFEREVYLSIDGKYSAYIEGPRINYTFYNKNRKHLFIPLNKIKDVDYDQHIAVFKYKDNIYAISYCATSDYYYIDTKNLYFFYSLEDEQINGIFESIPKKYQCKISIQNDHKVKFYDEVCERRMKEILRINSTDSSSKEETEENEEYVYNIVEKVYNSIDLNYITYIEGSNIDYKMFNRNGKYLHFPFHDNKGIYYNKYIVIFKNDNDIYILTSSTTSYYYYIDTKNMYFFISLKDKESKEKFESIPKEYQCKISIQDDHKIKFYDKDCEQRIKEMLKITSINK